jgi:hypothetical protein
MRSRLDLDQQTGAGPTEGLTLIGSSRDHDLPVDDTGEVIAAQIVGVLAIHAKAG